jgi:hypothetical protein
MSEKRIYTHDELKGMFIMPHEVIDLWHNGQLSFEDCNLLLYGTKAPPVPKYKTDAQGNLYLDLTGGK